MKDNSGLLITLIIDRTWYKDIGNLKIIDCFPPLKLVLFLIVIEARFSTRTKLSKDFLSTN